ncbi:MAG: YceI family protein [Armatimonadetes bacterium]|nr:YceI family protein [Armatimonadota bacterium]
MHRWMYECRWTAGRLAALVTVLLASVFAMLPPPASAAAPAAGPPGVLERFVIVPSESRVTYHVGEYFINQNNRYNVAVGVTQIIRGELFIDRARPRNSRVGTITVDISQFRSDSERRDNYIRNRNLESARYPIAEFTPTEIRGLPESHVEGREIAVQITGNLRVRDVTRPTTFATILRLEGNTVTGMATTTIKMMDFGFDPPAIFGLLRTENEARLEFRFTARRATQSSISYPGPTHAGRLHEGYPPR